MTLTSIITEATKLVMSFIFWVPLFFLFWIVAGIIWTSTNPEKRKQAGYRLTWAVLAMFILVSIGGILAILNQTFFSSSSTLAQPPGNLSGPTNNTPTNNLPNNNTPAPNPFAPFSPGLNSNSNTNTSPNQGREPLPQR